MLGGRRRIRFAVRNKFVGWSGVVVEVFFYFGLGFGSSVLCFGEGRDLRWDVVERIGDSFAYEIR